MLKYNLGSPTGGGTILLDNQVYCRLLVDMSCTLGWFSEPSDPTKRDFISLDFNARYYSDTGCLLMVWKVTPDYKRYHRSEIIEWNGGITAHLRVNETLNSALEDAARLLGNPNFAQGAFYKDPRPPWTSRDEFKPVMEAVYGKQEIEYLTNERNL